MTICCKTKNSNADRRLDGAVAGGSDLNAGRGGRRHLNFIERRNGAGALKSGRALRLLMQRICARLQSSRLKWHSVSRESGTEKVQLLSRAQAWSYLPAAREIHGSCLCFLFVLLFATGCVSAHKKGRTIHERFDYQIVQEPGCPAQALLTCHEIWEDEFKGGGEAFLADPTASQLVSVHTNQLALGGGSTLMIGSLHSEVSTNGIRAVGDATGEIIQDAGAAAGQLINKSVTGTPVKP